MKTSFSYDLLIIGGGISASVFASKYLQNENTVKIALIEAGRGLGGRSSTRISKKFNGWKQELELKCYIKNYFSIFTQGLEQYLLENNYPILDEENKMNYIYYNKDILNIFYNEDYSESL